MLVARGAVWFLLLLGGAFLLRGCGKRLCAVRRRGGQPPAWLLPGRQTRFSCTALTGGPAAMCCMPLMSGARRSVMLVARWAIWFLLLCCL